MSTDHQRGEHGRPDLLEGIAAAVLVPPEHRELVTEALSFAERIDTAADVEGLLAADAELIVVEHALLADAELGGDPSAPIRVVIQAPHEARVALQMTGKADLAVEPGIDGPELRARIEALLRRARLERDRSPLTALPGNRWLVRHLREALGEGREVGLLLLDIDDFKEYNDRCGHLRGDAAIAMLGRVAVQAADSVEGAFVAHIGGDDFCIMCAPPALDALADACRQQFDGDAPAGLTITLAATVIAHDDADALEEVFERVARLKSDGKLRPGSSYVRG